MSRCNCRVRRLSHPAEMQSIGRFRNPPEGPSATCAYLACAVRLVAGTVELLRRLTMLGRTDEKANPSRGGGAKPRDSTSQPGCRIGVPTGTLLSHSVSWGRGAMQQGPEGQRHGLDWRQKVRKPLSISVVVVAAIALVAVLVPAGAMALSLTGGTPSATPKISGPSNPPVGGVSTPTSTTTTTMTNPTTTTQPATTTTSTIAVTTEPTTVTTTTNPTTTTTSPTTTTTEPMTATTQPTTPSPPGPGPVARSGANVVLKAAASTDVATPAASTTKTCGPDPSAAIEALPDGGVWNGGGKCYVMSNAGIVINQPVTVENASFTNPQKLTQGEPHTDFMHPFITVNSTSNVTLANLTLTGENATPSYHGLPWVAEEGIKLNSSHDVSISNITTNNTFGDGLIFDQASGKGPCQDITVNNYTVNTTGRQGVTIGSIENSTLNNVHIGHTAESGWDFESDSAAGSGNITVNNASGAGVHMNEPLFGPVTFNNPDIRRGHVWMLSAAAASGQPVTFNGGTILLRLYDNGSPPAGITVQGPGHLTFNDVKIGNVRSAYERPHGASWNATDGAHITFNNSTPTGPAGSNDATSTVTFEK